MTLSPSSHQYSDHHALYTDPHTLQPIDFRPLKAEYICLPFEAPQIIGNGIKQSLNNFLSLSDIQAQKYMDDLTVIRPVTLDDCKDNLCDKGLIGQRGLFANHFLPAYSVLGLYSGILLQTEQDLITISHHFELDDIYDYLFRIDKDSPWPKVTGYKYGNRMSLINAASNFESGLEEGYKDVYDRQNIVSAYGKSSNTPLSVGNIDGPNLVFFVTYKDIQAGEQIFYNYGPSYWKK